MASTQSPPKHIGSDSSHIGQGPLPPWTASGSMGLPLGKNGGKLRKANGRPKSKYNPNSGIPLDADFGGLSKLRNSDVTGQWNSAMAMNTVSDNISMRRPDWNTSLRESWPQSGLLDSYDYLDGDSLKSLPGSQNNNLRHGRSHGKFVGASPGDGLFNMYEDGEPEGYYGRRAVSQALGQLRFDRFEENSLDIGRGTASGRRNDLRESRDARLWREGDLFMEGSLAKDVSGGYMSIAAREEEHLQLRRAQQLLRQHEGAQQQQTLHSNNLRYGKQQHQHHHLSHEQFGQEQQSAQKVAAVLEQQRLLMHALALDEIEGQRFSKSPTMNRQPKNSARQAMDFEDHFFGDAVAEGPFSYAGEQGKNHNSHYEVANGRVFFDGYQSHSPRSVQDFPEAMAELSRRPPSPPQGVYERGLWRPLEQQIPKQRADGPSEWKPKRKEQSFGSLESASGLGSSEDALSLPSQDEMDFFLASVQFVR